MYCIEAFIDFELFVFFILKWKPQKTRHISILGLAYLCFGITRILLIFWDFESNGFGEVHLDENAVYYTSAAFFAFLAMTVFMYAAESLLRKTHYIFTIAFFVVSFIVLFFDIQTLRSLYYIFVSGLMLFVIFFLFRLMAMVTGTVRKKFFTLFIGFVLYGLGYALSAELVKDAIPRPIAVGIVIIGLACIALACVRIPMFEEIHWRDYLLHVFVFHIDSSACIHDEMLLKIGKEVDGVSADLFSSGVTGVIGIIKEMIQSEKKLKVLDHEDKKILLEYGKHVTVALITSKDLDILHEKLRTYILRVETELRKPLENWRGEVSRFAPQMKTITTDILKTDIDKNWWRVDPRSVYRQVVGFLKKLYPKDLIDHLLRRKRGQTDSSNVVAEEVHPSSDLRPNANPTPVPPEEDPWPAPAATNVAKQPLSATVSSKSATMPVHDENGVQPSQEAQSPERPAMPASNDASGHFPAPRSEVTDVASVQKQSEPPIKAEKAVKPAKKTPAKSPAKPSQVRKKK